MQGRRQISRQPPCGRISGRTQSVVVAEFDRDVAVLDFGVLTDDASLQMWFMKM